MRIFRNPEEVRTYFSQKADDAAKEREVWVRDLARGHNALGAKVERSQAQVEIVRAATKEQAYLDAALALTELWPEMRRNVDKMLAQRAKKQP